MFISSGLCSISSDEMVKLCSHIVSSQIYQYYGNYVFHREFCKCMLINAILVILFQASLWSMGSSYQCHHIHNVFVRSNCLYRYI